MSNSVQPHRQQPTRLFCPWDSQGKNTGVGCHSFLWDNIKCTNIRIIGVLEEEEKKKGYEKIFEEIRVGNFPNMEKEIVNQVQKAQRVLYRINPRRNMSRHILIKLTKTKHKERILKAAREKQQVTYKGNPICLTADLSAETLQSRREWKDIFKVLKGKSLQ